MSNPQNTLSTPDPNHGHKSGGNEDGKGTFTLLLFASASTYTGCDSLILPAPMTLSQLFRTLEKRYPGIGKKVLRSCAVTVNLEYVDFDPDGLKIEGTVGDGKEEEVEEGKEEGKYGKQGEENGVVWIQKGDEVGIIPPVSSG